MSALGTEAPSTWGPKHWTHRRPDWLTARGEKHPNAKLTAAQVRVMRREHRAGVPANRLAKLYGVCPKTARLALAGETWRHVR